MLSGVPSLYSHAMENITLIPDGCAVRPASPGMVASAFADLQIDPKISLLGKHLNVPQPITVPALPPLTAAAQCAGCNYCGGVSTLFWADTQHPFKVLYCMKCWLLASSQV